MTAMNDFVNAIDSNGIDVTQLRDVPAYRGISVRRASRFIPIGYDLVLSGPTNYAASMAEILRIHGPDAAIKYKEIIELAANGHSLELGGCQHLCVKASSEELVKYDDKTDALIWYAGKIHAAEYLIRKKTAEFLNSLENAS